MTRFSKRAAALTAAALASSPVTRADPPPASTPPPNSAPTKPALAPPPSPADVPDFGEAIYDGIVFIKIPAGAYRRGTTDEQREMLKQKGLWRPADADEQPAKEIRIARPFFLSKYEVTQDQWTKVMGEKNPSAFKGGTLPVEQVKWDDAQAFCQALRDKTKATYRLPTEAEWEYAARAGGDGIYGAGADKQPIMPETLGDYAWMNANAESKTHPVGKKKSNAWGLCDMLGNVWEWCEDAFSVTAYRQPAVVDPTYRSATATERVFRGGSWFLDARSQRVALRGGNLPTFKSAYVGFRLVREM